MAASTRIKGGFLRELANVNTISVREQQNVRTGIKLDASDHKKEKGVVLD